MRFVKHVNIEQEREWKMRYLTPDEVKQGELEILLAFDNIAKEHGLRYSLEGGTLLGAVRHKGFIPWDDDIDIMMLRADYDKLVAIAKTDIPLGHFKFTGYEIDGYPMPFIKMFDTRVVVEEAVMSSTITEHLWIDVFPIDALPEDENEARRAFRKSFLLRALIKTGNYKFVGAGKHWYKRMVRMMIYPFVKLFRLNDWAERMMCKLAKSYGDASTAEYVGMLVWGYGMSSRNRAELFKETCLLEFEGHMFPAIAGWDQRLRSLYGDYMEIPPIEKRATHSVTAYVTDCPATEGGGR